MILTTPSPLGCYEVEARVQDRSISAIVAGLVWQVTVVSGKMLLISTDDGVTHAAFRRTRRDPRVSCE
jgi:hypothetical protein